MKNIYRVCFTLIFLLQGMFILGQDFVPEWNAINPTATPPTIDGTIDAVWSDATSVPIENVYSGTIVDAADFSAYWRGIYNDTALFLLIHVMDDTLMNQEPNAWSNDNVEIFLNVKQKYDVMAKDGPRYDNDKMQYRVVYDQTDSTGTNADWTDVLFTSAADANGYVVEIAFPFSTIMIDTTPGHSTWIGFDLMVSDKDSVSSAILTWSNPGDVTSSWNDMDQAGILTFSEGLPLVSDFTLLSDLIADATAMLDVPKPQEAMDSLQAAIDDAQAVVDAGTANQPEIIAGMLDLGAVMVYYDQTVLPVEGEFSDIEFLGNAKNYTEADPWLWSVFTDSTDMQVVYGIIEDKPAGGNRTSILNERTYGAHGDFFVKADMKLQKRPSAVDETAWWEDGRLYFAWQDENNYAWAQFFNTHGPAKENPIGQTDALGFSGFNFIVDGQGYGYIHSDDPGDPIEEIPPETCIPFEGDTSFYDWNEVMVTLEDSVLSMWVNGEVYHAIGLDTVSLIQYYTGNRLDTIDVIPSAVLDFIFTPGQIGVGSSNDRVYFDNVDAGYVPVDGIFSNIEIYGDAANYDEAEAWLWDVFDDDGETVYGIVQDKPAGGNRTSIVTGEKLGGHDYSVEADMKLQKRPSAVEETAWWENGRLFFAWQDENNYAWAQFFNTHGPAKEDPIGQTDALGLSGFNFIVDGKGYGYIHSDDPGDPIEEIPPETCIPFDGDTSFDDWNHVAVTLEDSVLSMLVNGEVYHAVGLDTVTVIQYYTGNRLDSIDEVPGEVMDLLFSAGSVGVGSSNDRVYFDNVNAGWIEVTGVFNEDDPMMGDAANYKENSPWLWDVFEEDGDMRYGLVLDHRTKGDRKSIYQGMEFGYDYYVSADMKLVKRYDGLEGETKFEDGVIYFSYIDEENFAQAMYFAHHGPQVENPVGAGDAFGISGFRVMYEGQEYRLTKADDPGDPIEEIPPERCIPYEDDSSFDQWNAIQFERERTIIRMLVNGDQYYAIDIDTLTMGQVYSGWQFSHWEELPQGAKDLMLGKGKIGIGSSNDKVYFDNVKADYLPVEGIFSDIPGLGDAGNYTETRAYLWSIIEDGDEKYYGVDVTKAEDGSARQSIYDELVLDEDFYVETEVKLFPRNEDGSPMFEDAKFFFNYTDDDNYATAWYFIHSWTEADANSWDPFGLSGFEVKVNGTEYRLKHFDTPGDPIEEIPPGSCIPYVDASSFDAWNTIRLEREGTILSMIVNEEVYWAIDVDTLTVINPKGTSDLVAIPQEVKDVLLGSGKIGIGSGNDKLYFDNVKAGLLTSVEDLRSTGSSSILLYPNPASGQFTLDRIEQSRKIEMYTVTGQKVMEMVTSGESTITISTENFNSGVYFIRTTMESGKLAINKLVIK
ncbi:MAG: sugar-binding protein [Bacteroidales bacterium]